MQHAANLGHEFAAKFIARYGHPTEPLAQANLASRLAIGLSPSEREVFAERAAGHFINAACGTSGL